MIGDRIALSTTVDTCTTIVRVDDPSTPQCRAHGDERELKSQPGKKAVQVGHTCVDGRRIRTQRVHIGSGQQVPEDDGPEGAQSRLPQALIEDQVGVLAVLTPARLRNESHGPDAQDLGHRHDQEPHVARGGEAGDRRVAELADEKEIDEVVQRLKDHPDRNRDGQLHEVPEIEPSVRSCRVYCVALAAWSEAWSFRASAARRLL